MKMYAIEAIMVFCAGYIIGKNRQKEKCKRCNDTPVDKKVHAEMKDGKVVLTFGEE